MYAVCGKIFILTYFSGPFITAYRPPLANIDKHAW
jgi:hypothetical protein